MGMGMDLREDIDVSLLLHAVDATCYVAFMEIARPLSRFSIQSSLVGRFRLILRSCMANALRGHTFSRGERTHMSQAECHPFL